LRNVGSICSFLASQAASTCNDVFAEEKSKTLTWFKPARARAGTKAGVEEDEEEEAEGQSRKELQMSESHTTTDHNAIRKWAEQRDGHPATVRATEEDGHAGILRLDFGPREERLEEISWDEFFRKFDEADLAFLYQERTKDGKPSRFHKFVRRSAA
jgi:hypothetical protein